MSENKGTTKSANIYLNEVLKDINSLYSDIEAAKFVGLENYEQTINSNLNYSILVGEYYDIVNQDLDSINSFFKGYSDTIDKTQNKIKEILKSPTFKEDIKNKLNSCKTYLDYIKLHLSYYNSFSIFLHHSLNDHGTNFINTDFEEYFFNLEWEKYIDPQTALFKIDDDNEYEKIVFIVNIIVAKYDEGYTCEYTVLDNLIKISKRLELIKKVKSFPVGAISYKLQFLIYKILYRFKNSNEIRKYIVYDEIQKKNIEYSIEKILNDTDNFFIKKYNAEIELVYKEIKENFGWENKFISGAKIKEQIEDLKISDGNTVYDIHVLAKIVKYTSVFLKKKEEKIFKKIKNKILDYEEKISKKNQEKDLNIFNKYAYSTAQFLIDNSKYKLYSAEIINDVNCSDDLDIIIERVEDITKYITNRTKELNDTNVLINEKFQFFRFCIKDAIDLLKLISKQLNNIEIEKRHDYVRLISSIRSYTETIYLYSDFNIKSINEAKMGRWMPIYLLRNECTLNIDESVKNLYNEHVPDKLICDSSYVLPSNYDFLLKTIEYDIEKLRNEDFLIRGAISIRVLQDYENKLDDKVKENQINAIQIIGLYAIIITFILGSINIVSKINALSYRVIYNLFFVFTSCMLLFLFMLRTIVQKSDKFKSFFNKLGLSFKNHFDKYARREIKFPVLEICTLHKYVWVTIQRVGLIIYQLFKTLISVRFNTNFFAFFLFVIVFVFSTFNIYNRGNIKSESFTITDDTIITRSRPQNKFDTIFIKRVITNNIEGKNIDSNQRSKTDTDKK